MSKWDELKKAIQEARPDAEWFRVKDLDCHPNIDTRAAKFIAAANPKAVLSLIEQNRELVKALQGFVDSFVELANSGDAGFFDPEEQDEVIAARAAIRKATGEE